jgi:hypothetical protein
LRISPWRSKAGSYVKIPRCEDVEVGSLIKEMLENWRTFKKSVALPREVTGVIAPAQRTAGNIVVATNATRITLYIHGRWTSQPST